MFAQVFPGFSFRLNTPRGTTECKNLQTKSLQTANHVYTLNTSSSSSNVEVKNRRSNISGFCFQMPTFTARAGSSSCTAHKQTQTHALFKKKKRQRPHNRTRGRTTTHSSADELSSRAESSLREYRPCSFTGRTKVLKMRESRA